MGSSTLGCGLLAFFGMVLLSSPSLRTGSARLLGDALAVLTAGFYAVYLLVMSVARERATASSLAFASSLLSTLTLLPIVPLAGEKLLPSAVVDWGVAHRAGSDLTSLRADCQPILEAHELAYRYRERGEPVLSGGSLALWAGDRVASSELVASLFVEARNFRSS